MHTLYPIAHNPLCRTPARRGGARAVSGRVLRGVLLLLLPALAAPSQANSGLLLTSEQVAAGGEALLALSLNAEAEGVCGLLVTLRYDRSDPASLPPLELGSVSQERLSPAFSDALFGTSGVYDPETDLAIPNRRRIAIAQGEPVYGPAAVMTIPFKVPADAPSGAVYTVEAGVQAYDFEGRRTTLEAAVGQVTVTAPDLAPGDVNGNGQVEVGDAVLVLRATVGLEILDAEQSSRADLDRNEDINVADAISILRRVVGVEG